MLSQRVLVIPRVSAPGSDLLSAEAWQEVPAVSLVHADDGETAALPTELRVAWSDHGLHLHFTCIDPLPFCGEPASADAPRIEEGIGVMLDPVGKRNQYMVIIVNPCGRVTDLRVESPLHHALDSEADISWECPGLRVHSRGERDRWSIELLIPFSGVTPAIATPRPGDRWTGNFFRVECQPLEEITAWQPSGHSPPDLHASEHFGILEFGPARVTRRP